MVKYCYIVLFVFVTGLLNCNAQIKTDLYYLGCYNCLHDYKKDTSQIKGLDVFATQYLKNYQVKKIYRKTKKLIIVTDLKNSDIINTTKIAISADKNKTIYILNDCILFYDAKYYILSKKYFNYIKNIFKNARFNNAYPFCIYSGEDIKLPEFETQ